MNIEPQYIIGLISVLSTIIFGIIGWLLNRMIKSVDIKIDRLADDIKELMIDVTSMKSDHKSQGRDIDKLTGAVEEQRGINLSQESRIVNHRHDIANLKNTVTQYAKLYDKLELRIEKLQNK